LIREMILYYIALSKNPPEVYIKKEKGRNNCVNGDGDDQKYLVQYYTIIQKIHN